MVIKRDSLRAQRDFYSPMTGGTEIRYSAAQSPVKGKYSSQVRDSFANLGGGTRRSAPIIKAVKTAMKKTDDPFSKIASQESIVPQESKPDVQAQIGAQLADYASAAQEALQGGFEQAGEAFEGYKKSQSKKQSERRAERAAQRKADQAALNKRFSGVETGLSNLGRDYKRQEQAAIDNMAKFRAEQNKRFSGVEGSLKQYEKNRIRDRDAASTRFKNFSAAQLKRDIQQDIATRKTAQDAKTYEQNRLKEGEKFKNRLSGIEQKQTNFSTKLQENERGQYAFRKKVDKRIGGVQGSLKQYEKNRIKDRDAASTRFANFSAAQLKRDIQQDIATRKTRQDQKAYEKTRAEQRARRQQALDQRISGVETKQATTAKETKTYRDIREKRRLERQQALDKRIGSVDKRIGGVETKQKTTAKENKTYRENISKRRH